VSSFVVATININIHANHLPGTLTTTKEGLTACEVADGYGHSHLYKILSPVIHHYLPANTLLSLQQRFHALILELADDVVSSFAMLPKQYY